MPDTRYFLGANTPSGFYSLYHELSDPDKFKRVYVIKSGPGSGKSTLMRRVGRHARAAGYDVEEILCSGDPDSLDAVIVPALGAAVVDGTSPHVIVLLEHFYGTSCMKIRRNCSLANALTQPAFCRSWGEDCR